MACADIFPLVQLIFVKSQLEIMCTGKQFAIGGNVIVNVKDARVAVNSDMAKHIMI